MNNVNRDALELAGRELPNVAYQTTTGVMFVAGWIDHARGAQQFTVHRQWSDGSITPAGPRGGFATRDLAMAFIQQKDKDGFL